MSGDPASLTLTPSLSSDPLDSSVNFTVTVEDEFGNPVPGAFVHFSITPASAGTIVPTAVTSEDGTAVVTLTDAAPADITVTATLGVLSTSAEADFGDNSTNTIHITAISPPNVQTTETFARDIDDAGVVVGSYEDTGGTTHAFYLNDGTYTTFDYPGLTGSGKETSAVAINSVGTIAGDFSSASGSSGFLFSNGVYTKIALPGSSATSVTGLDASNRAVGYSQVGGQVESFVYDQGHYATLDVPGEDRTYAGTISDTGGFVIGSAQNSNSTGGFTTEGFIYSISTGSYTPLNYSSDTVPASEVSATTANAVNSSGQVVGTYTSGGETYGYLYSNGVFSPITPSTDAIDVDPMSINDKGDIVGEFKDSSGIVHGFLDRDGTYTTFDVAGGTPFTSPVSINNSDQIVGDYLDSSGISQIFLAEPEPACFCRGTLIVSQKGDVAVEALAIGDLVQTPSGLRPVKWIGRRSYGGRFIVGRQDMLPICFKAGSLDEGSPRRDLWISPHHAMYLDGILIEAKDLLNGASIVQAEGVDLVDYFHLELDSHDVILAEGAWSETFIDDDSRCVFHNAHEFTALYPDAVSGQPRYCAPRRNAGFEVESVRQRLARRAGLAAPPVHAGALRGHVDLVGARSIAGWAQNIDHPEAPVCLDIYVGDRLIGQTLANLYREDLREAGLGSGRHAFRFAPTAGEVLAPGSVEVRRSSDGALLARAAAAIAA
jgi:probable HAF family extracellular repeat protein